MDDLVIQWVRGIFDGQYTAQFGKVVGIGEGQALMQPSTFMLKKAGGVVEEVDVNTIDVLVEYKGSTFITPEN